MAGNIKINPDIAEGVASTFRAKRDELENIITALDREVNANVGSGKPAWEGQQATDFEGSWTTEFKPALTKLKEALNGANELLTKTIAAYRALDS